jgi:hypothetical protein
MLSESELDDRLSRSNPANRAALEDEGVRAALVSVQRSVESRASAEPPPRSVRGATYRRRWVLSGVVAVFVAVVTLVGVQALTGGNRSSGLPFAVPSAAASQLNKVARAAAGQSTPAVGQWEYLAVKMESTQTISAAGARIAFADTATIQSWTATDGVERQRVTGRRFSFLSPRDKAAYLAHEAAFDAYLHSYLLGFGPTSTGTIQDQMFPSPHTRAPTWETAPPSDPHALLNELWHQYRSVNPHQATDPHMNGLKVTLNALRSGVSWGELSQVLLSSTSAKLRSRAYAALAYVSGTKVLGHQTDQLGRPGIAISRTEDDDLRKQTLIVSPSTGDLLERDETLTSRRDVHGIPTATLTAHEIYLQRSIVNSDTALPGGGNQPFVPSSQR